MYIYENSNWPNFAWDHEKVNQVLKPVIFQQGRLLGKMENLGFSLQEEAVLKIMTNEVLKTSEIEGEVLARDEVRSSIARHLGMDIAGLLPADRHVDGIVEMLLDATRNYAKPLTEKRLFHWHAALFPTGISGMVFGGLIVKGLCRLFQEVMVDKKYIFRLHRLKNCLEKSSDF